MKLIGVIGGTSWPSTILPYRMINEDVNARLGGFHSARILLYSIDYHPIKNLYHHGWDKIPELLRHEFDVMMQRKPDCIMMACNTLHKAYDIIAEQLNLPVPFFHAVDVTSDFVVAQKFKKVLLLGTQFTMEDGFFAHKMIERGIEVIVPDVADREKIQTIQWRLAKGESDAAFGDYFKQLFQTFRVQGCDAVITACTELPLAINQSQTSMKVVDPLVLQCKSCVDYALA
jgi:aspartate racemase